MTAHRDRLLRILGADAGEGLRQRLRQRFERSPTDTPPIRIRFTDLSVLEHRVLAGLLGQPSREAGALTVEVARIDAALQRAELANSLRHALEQIDGPIADRGALRLQAQDRWDTVIGTVGGASLQRLLQSAEGLGLLKRLSGAVPERAERLLRQTEVVLDRLPASGLTRAQLAAQTLGDAHALDDGRAVATLVLACVPPSPVSDSVEDQDERRRDRWARWGVLVNELARPALHLNLPTAIAPEAGACPGEPSYSSLRQLLRASPAWAVACRTVFVCENPNVVAIAADRLGPRCAPLVCTDGMPAAAQRTLLGQLRHAGALLCYHGDFDWPGMRIAGHVMQAHAASPWRLGLADYRAAVGTLGRLAGEHSLGQTPVPTPWDVGLMTTMQATGLAVAEEAVIEALLLDLIRPQPRRVR